jgi:hypothetical protein
MISAEARDVTSKMQLPYRILLPNDHENVATETLKNSAYSRAPQVNRAIDRIGIALDGKKVNVAVVFSK